MSFWIFEVWIVRFRNSACFFFICWILEVCIVEFLEFVVFLSWAFEFWIMLLLNCFFYMYAPLNVDILNSLFFMNYWAPLQCLLNFFWNFLKSTSLFEFWILASGYHVNVCLTPRDSILWVFEVRLKAFPILGIWILSCFKFVSNSSHFFEVHFIVVSFAFWHSLYSILMFEVSGNRMEAQPPHVCLAHGDKA